MVSPYAVDLNQTAQNAFPREPKRANEGNRAVVVRDDVRRDPVQAEIFKRMVNERSNRVAHQALAWLACRKPVANVAVEARPLADAAEACDSNHPAIVARTDEKASPPI